MASERVLTTPVKQSFDKIEDSIVVDAIGNRMQHIHDSDGSLYDHETHHATHSIMYSIAEACAQAYQPGDSHEEVWRRAQEQCLAQASQQDPDTDTQEQQPLITAFAMYALDRRDGYVLDDSHKAIDEFIYRHPNLARKAADKAWAEGLVTYTPDGEPPAQSVENAINTRKRELRTETIAGLFESMDRLAKPEEQESQWGEDRHLEDWCIRLNSMGGLMSDREVTEYIKRITEIPESSPDLGYAFGAITSQQLLAGVRDTCDKAVWEKFGILLLSCAAQNDIRTQDNSDSVLTALNGYFPGGLTGDEARSHPEIQALAESAGSYAELLIRAIPPTNFETSTGNPDQTINYNAAAIGVQHQLCRHLFETPGFATRFSCRMADSLTPRKYTPEGIYNAGFAGTLRRLVILHEKFGAHALERLHKTIDIGAIDMFTENDVATWLGLLDDDSTVIQRLQASDVSVIPFDSYGSTNEAMAVTLHLLRPTNDTSSRVIVPWTRPSDLYRALILLKKRNVQFCNLVFSLHGNPSRMSAGTGFDGFTIQSTARVSDVYWDHRPKLNIDQSQIRRIVSEYMCGAKHVGGPSAFGKKRIIFASCYSDVSTELTPSVAEATLTESADTNTIVLGTDDITSVHFDPYQDTRGILLFGRRKGDPLDMEPTTSNVTKLELSGSSGWIKRRPRVKRTPHDERVAI
ncbi:MAG TPA: hypothetical protein PKV96_02175 [Candidatus Saccharimonas sp.]|nr:hypothetical protein [Candidatus Saccharimonas sp.]